MVQFTMNLKINIYLAILLERQSQKKTRNKRGEFAVADSGRTKKFMAVSDHLKNVRPTTNIIIETFTNGNIIISTMEGELDLPMIPDISTQAHIFPNTKIH